MPLIKYSLQLSDIREVALMCFGMDPDGFCCTSSKKNMVSNKTTVIKNH